MSRLNPRQQEAVNYVGGPLLVLAGAGSGKTSVITRKIAYLVQQCGIRAQYIVAVTFTNKAAREMKERVGTLLRGGEGKGLTVSTFHNLGLNIIRKEHERLGYKPGFSIFDESDIKALLTDIMQKEYSGDDGVDEIKNYIGAWKNDLILPEEALEKARNPKEQTAAIVYLHYQRTLRAYNAVDFDDLILQPVKLFQEHPDVLQKWQNKVRYMLVDEYQDTNASQYLLVKLLVKDRAQFTVVGDDDQSIYAWRGARPENLMQLKEDFPSLKVVMLEQNYRSTSRILKCANVLIANNPHVFEKQLWSEMGHGDPIRVIRCRNEDAEAERIAMEILTLHLRTERPYSEFAILYRGNHQAKLMELKLQHHQIPYRLSGGTSFFGRQEVKDLMSYFRLLVNPDDDNAFLRVINVPRREIGSATLEKLGNYATQRKIRIPHEQRLVPHRGTEEHPRARRGRRHDHRAGHRQAGPARHAGAPAGRRGRRRRRADDDPARVEGAGVPLRVHHGHGGRDPAPPFQHRGRHGGRGAPPGLRRHHPRAAEPGDDLRRQAQAIRRDHRLLAEPLPRRTAPRRPRMGRHGRRPARGQGGQGQRRPRRHPRHAQALSPPRLDCLDFHKSVLPDA